MLEIFLAAFQLFSSSKQGDAVRSASRLSAMFRELNADFAEVDAINAEKQGFSEAARYKGITDATIGAQRAVFGGEDVDVGFGTAAQKIAESKTTALLNTLDIHAAARNKAYGFKVEAANLRLNAGAEQIQSAIDEQSIRTRGALAAGGTIIQSFRNQSVARRRL